MSLEQAIQYVRSGINKFREKPVFIYIEIHGKKVRTKVDHDVFSDLIFKNLAMNYVEKNIENLLWISDNINLYPEKVRRVLKSYVEAFADIDDEGSEAMYQSVICREFPTETENVSKIISNWTFLSSLLGTIDTSKVVDSNRCYLDVEQTDSDLIIKGALASNKPVLVIGGELDFVTSPKYVTEVSANMPNSHSEVFKNVGHGVFSEKRCISDTVISYLLTGSYVNRCK